MSLVLPLTTGGLGLGSILELEALRTSTTQCGGEGPVSWSLPVPPTDTFSREPRTWKGFPRVSLLDSIEKTQAHSLFLSSSFGFPFGFPCGFPQNKKNNFWVFTWFPFWSSSTFVPALHRPTRATCFRRANSTARPARKRSSCAGSCEKPRRGPLEPLTATGQRIFGLQLCG